MSSSYSKPVSGDPYQDAPIVLLSLDPEWAEAILDGEKRYEYRRTAPAVSAPFRLLLYATAPVQAVVGAAWVEQVITGPVDGLIENTVGLTPHDKDELQDYFDGKYDGSALSIMGYIPYDEPVDLGDIHPPQNFRYLRDEKHSELIDRLPYERGIPYEQ